MPEEQKPDAEAQNGEVRKKSKKALFLGGGVLALVLVAWFASMMAVPSKTSLRVFDGPFVSALYPEKISVNLKGQSNKRFLVMSLNVEFDAYERSYVTARTSDLLYQAMLKDALIDVASRKTVEQATDAVEKELLLDEIREGIEPLLFPIQIGDSPPGGGDPASGLRPGVSAHKSSMRGPLDDHVVHLSTTDHTLRLDDGPAVKYRGTETDLLLSDAEGASVFVDVTRLVDDFEGDLHIGVAGRVRNIYLDSYLIQ
jgi:flagellar basal body-associated protein FliL